MAYKDYTGVENAAGYSATFKGYTISRFEVFLITLAELPKFDSAQVQFVCLQEVYLSMWIFYLIGYLSIGDGIFNITLILKHST